jgi:flagellar biosynthesis chaperone FliJ
MKKILAPAIIAGILIGFLIWKFFMQPQAAAENAILSHDESAHQHEAHATVKGDANQQLMDEIMALHDEVMPKMSRVAELQQKMSNMATATKDKALKDKQLDLAAQLEKADEAMFAWMEKFPEGTALEKMSEQEAATVLQAEKAKVISMKEQVLTAIAQTESFIMNLKK